MQTMRGQNARWGYVVTAMVTPFDSNDNIDFAKAQRLAKWLMANGTTGLVINGTTGESPTTSASEKTELVAAIVEAVGAKNVIAGAGGNNTKEVLEQVVANEKAGASGQLLVTGYYNKPSQEGLYQHFRTAAEATSLPCMLYNVPARTIVNVEAPTTVRLVKDVSNIVATKEASANLQQIADIVRQTPDSFDVYSGDDGTLLPTLAIGGAGIVSVIAHVAGKRLLDTCEAWFAGKPIEALQHFLPTLPITKATFAYPSPAPIKYLTEKAFGESLGGLRLPLVALTETEKQAVDKIIASH
jgi:4-hydroxy-tetrahydrodipicolinate synthase